MSPITFQVVCPCCGEAVEASDAGFSATTVTVAACSALRAAGAISSEIRKSAAYEAAVPAASGWQHRNGLVTSG